MRKLKLQTQVSVDGFMAGPNGEMDFMVWNWDDKLKDFVTVLTQPVDTILLGHNLAKGFIDHWAKLAEAKDADWFSKKMTLTPKVVFSRSLKTNPWKHTTISNDDLASEVMKIKGQAGGDIIAYGGSQFVSSLSKENLIDDYYLFVNPTARGSGLPVFSEKRPLKLAEAMPFECGITVLHYQPADDKK